MDIRCALCVCDFKAEFRFDWRYKSTFAVYVMHLFHMFQHSFVPTNGT